MFDFNKSKVYSLLSAFPTVHVHLWECIKPVSECVSTWYNIYNIKLPILHKDLRRVQFHMSRSNCWCNFSCVVLNNPTPQPKQHHNAVVEGREELQPEITKVLGDIRTVQGRQENIMLVLDALKQ